MAAGGESARVVGRYEVLEEIAAGGMATVHLGRVLGTAAGPPQFIAVKRMHSQYARDEDFRSMFLDEARLCAFIEHENVVRTLDVVDAGGELLLILELIDGESLSRLAKQATARGSRIPIPITATIMTQVLRGLHAAHEAVSESGEPLHMVHRDVSPHNILVGSDGVVRVVDFGVAKARGRMQQTAQGQIKGKLAYMSPEQARGKQVDRRGDVFAAGIVLWELLVGKRLFEGENEAHVLTQLLTEKPPLLGERDPSLSAFEPIVTRALSVEPDARFASALEMALAIEERMPTVERSELSAWVGTEASVSLAKRRDLIARHVAVASRTDFEDTPRRELDEASTDGGSSPVAAPSRPLPGELPSSAFMTQKLGPNDRPTADLALPRYSLPPSVGRPSDAPPAQSQVTAVALATNELPPPLPQERVRQLFTVGAISALTVTLTLGSVLVIASKRAPHDSLRSAPAAYGLTHAALAFRSKAPRPVDTGSAVASPTPSVSASSTASASPASSSSTTAIPQRVSPPRTPAPPLPKPSSAKPTTSPTKPPAKPATTPTKKPR